MFHRRWTLLLLQGGPRLRVSDKGPRHYELPAEPTCRPASGRHIADSVSQLRRVGRLCAVYRVICPRLDRASRVYTCWGPLQSRNYRSPAYESPSRRGDLAPHQRRIRRDTDSLPLSCSCHFTFSSSLRSISSSPVHDPPPSDAILIPRLSFFCRQRSLSPSALAMGI